MALWGSGYDQARAYVEFVHRRKILQAFWTERGLTQFQVKPAVNAAMRGGSWVSRPQSCRSSARQLMGDRDQRNYLGVRVIIRKASTAGVKRK